MIMLGFALWFITFCIAGKVIAQNNTATNLQLNSASSMMVSDRKLNIGGYGQVDYNQPFGIGTIQNGKLDVHRVVLLFGYRFTNKLSLITEIEFEHIKEVFVEQAFINYAFNTYFNFRAGLLLIPMGIINEYHEPPTFNGVERPLIDKYITPTTWREIGLGVAGSIPEVSMKYQLFIVNGFKSYANGEVYLNGKNGLRKGRQKGAESIMHTPNITARISYYGILGLNIGLSGYFGKTQSTMYKELKKDDLPALAAADSSVVGLTMLGVDARYDRKGFNVRWQLYFASLTNTKQYNYFGKKDGIPNDLGSSMYGYYIEVSYNVFYPLKKMKNQLIPFVRFSNYDTQASIAGDLPENDKYNITAVTAGIGFWFIPQVALKTDVQFIRQKTDTKFNKLFNVGMAFMF